MLPVHLDTAVATLLYVLCRRHVDKDALFEQRDGLYGVHVCYTSRGTFHKSPLAGGVPIVCGSWEADSSPWASTQSWTFDWFHRISVACRLDSYVLFRIKP